MQRRAKRRSGYTLIIKKQYAGHAIKTSVIKVQNVNMGKNHFSHLTNQKKKVRRKKYLR